VVRCAIYTRKSTEEGLMALAIRFEGLLRDGTAADLSELARLAGVTQPRMTQIMNLNHLAPDIQEQLLFLPPVAEWKDRSTSGCCGLWPPRWTGGTSGVSGRSFARRPATLPLVWHARRPPPGPCRACGQHPLEPAFKGLVVAEVHAHETLPELAVVRHVQVQ
jgi:hypothetical protein